MRYGFLVLLVACNGPSVKDTGVALAGPTLSHTAPTAAVEGTSVEFDVTATDTDGVGPVALYHRVAGETSWTLTPMDAAGDDVWTTTLTGDDVAAPAVEYYFKAEDAGDPPAYSYLPRQSTAAPYSLPVSVVGMPLPYVEGFEYDDTQTSLLDLGWGSTSLGFSGYEWDVTATTASEGTQAAYHSRGFTGIPALEDWLISPALDFSAVSSAQVTWQEKGANVSAANHALYISTGSFKPDDGDYVAVTESLPAPTEGAWGRSAVYDLSAYAGSATVYLAWRFVGDYADDWYIDDVRVQELQPDLTIDTSVTPSPVRPGDTGTYTVTVTNSSTVDASDLSVALAFPSGGASVAEETVSIPSVPAGGTGTADFSLTVDPATPDNSYVPVDVTVSSADTSWSESDKLLVGNASTVTIDYIQPDAGSLEMVLGVGDPDAPTWEETVFSGDGAGGVSLSLDVTDEFALLPPAAGDLRWFLRTTPEAAGELTDLTITYDGVAYPATVLPTIVPGDPSLTYVPEPPDLRVTARTLPSELAPGDTGVALAVSMSNAGAATQGAVTATLSSTDPDVTVTDGGPVALTSGVFDAGGSVSLSGLFAFDVSAAHVDSTDVGLDLLLDDGVESWTVPVSFDVPFPYLRVSDITIDDDGGDGILDPGETADLTFEITNVGDQATDGTLLASISAEASSTAVTTLSSNVEVYRSLQAGRSASPSDPYSIAVDGGADGDSVDLLLTLVDSSRSYEVRTSIILGEPPWQALDPQDDPTGDALDSWDFDILNGSYRVMDGVLQIKLTSATVFDPDRLFIEAWGSSTVADWTYYRLVLQSGVVSLQGYGSSGFENISTPVVSYPDAYDVQFDITLADMGLTLDSLSMGFASGWCGPDEYYCDHYPDGWGYPYDTWSPSLFFDLSW